MSHFYNFLLFYRTSRGRRSSSFEQCRTDGGRESKNPDFFPDALDGRWRLTVSLVIAFLPYTVQNLGVRLTINLEIHSFQIRTQDYSRNLLLLHVSIMQTRFVEILDRAGCKTNTFFYIFDCAEK